MFYCRLSQCNGFSCSPCPGSAGLSAKGVLGPRIVLIVPHSSLLCLKQDVSSTPFPHCVVLPPKMCPCVCYAGHESVRDLLSEQQKVALWSYIYAPSSKGYASHSSLFHPLAFPLTTSHCKASLLMPFQEKGPLETFALYQEIRNLLSARLLRDRDPHLPDPRFVMADVRDRQEQLHAREDMIPCECTHYSVFRLLQLTPK
jgi:hypothetical protein